MKNNPQHESNLAIQLENINKKYTIHHEKPTLVETFINGREETFWALKNINLTIKKGERIGIIGHNGSGKTTLLKVITGITTPTSGKVVTQGKIISLIDIQAGFHEELTGEQNIFLNGMLIGMSKKEILKNLVKIISFADIKQFIDAPLFTYSQGMVLRLGFAIAIHAEPDILVLDEGIHAGDSDFNKKLTKKIFEFSKKNKTIIVVSHWIEFVKKHCQTVYTLSNGELIQQKTYHGK